MKITTTSALATLGLIAPFLLEGVNGDSKVVVDSPSRMQRLTRRGTVDLSSSAHSKRNATTFVPRQDKVDSTVSNSTTSSSTIGDIVEKQYNEQVSTSHGSPYNIKAVLELLHEGFVDLPKQALVRRGEGDDKDNGKMSTTSVTTTNNDDEECEEEAEEDDDEECEEEDDADDDEECEDDGEEEECDAEGDDNDEDCEDGEEDGNAVSPIDGVVDFSAIPTPNNLAQGSLQSKDGCTKFATAVSGDTCYKLIGARDDELLKVFYKNNPSVDSGCKNLKVDSAYCVSSAPVSAPAKPVTEEPKKNVEEQKPVVAIPTPPTQQNNIVKEAKPDVKVEAPVAVVVDVKKDESNPKKENNNGGGAKKNDYDAKASYYFQKGNAGACGNKKSDNDYIVALHPSLYNNGARCGQKISLTNKSTGKTLVAEVQDLCPTCEGGSQNPQIDLSKKLFGDLSNGADGIFQVTYGFM